MSSDEELYEDSGNESPYIDDDEEEDEFGSDIGLGEEPGPSDRHDGGGHDDDDFSFEILSTEQIVQHMVKCISEVTNVIQIPPTTVRILLNHFKWDKEKLMERYYGDEQDQEK